MVKELTRNALARLHEDPGVGLISISQNDCAGRCECARCKAVEAEEGSPAGPLLRVVNAVAEAIEREFPDVLVETLAYQYTRKPPTVTRPRKNVVVRLCSIECSFPAVGWEAERGVLQRHSRVEPRRPAPVHLGLRDEFLQLHSAASQYAGAGAEHPLLRRQSRHRSVRAGRRGLFRGRLRAAPRWLLAHLMWDPRRDPQSLIREFADGYYGPAGPHLVAYLNHLHDAAERSGVYLKCYMHDTSAWMTLADMNRAAQLFDQATAAVAGDPALAARVRRERLSLDHAWLQRYDSLRRARGAAAASSLAPKTQRVVRRVHRTGREIARRPVCRRAVVQ